MTSAHATDLLERRRRLLDRGETDSTELSEVTEQLAEVLGRRDPVVRRVALDDPAPLLDRLVEGEPVHPFSGRADLEDRLDVDRRCFLLEHPALPDTPLNVVWCALTLGVPHRVSDVLDTDAPPLDPHAADTAVFYSIWNVEPGLVGLPGGRELLEGAIPALRDEFGGIESFVTLSPVPGFRRWCEEQGFEPADDERRLERACARYLVTLDERGRPADPVARFHLGNGARVLAVRAGGDRSDRGMARSFGVMANYRYEPEDRDANRRSLDAGLPSVSTDVAALLER